MISPFESYEYVIADEDEQIVFSYKGPLNNVLLSEFSSNLRYRLHLEENSTSLTKKIFAIFMELAQNVLYYSKELDNFDSSDRVGSVVISRNRDRYKVMTGNMVYKDAIPKLIEKCSTINTLERDALRDYKIEQRNLPKDEESKGAGIGLIQVALTSDNALEVNFKEYEGEFAFYMVGVNVNRA